MDRFAGHSSVIGRHLALALAAVLTAGCGDAGRGSSGTEDDVVAMVAKRDGLSEDDAKQRVADVHRLAEAARAEQSALADPPPLVDEERARFIRRGALARLWMSEVFEPAHDVDAIPADDPILEKALASPVHVRPKLHRLCQLVAVPSGFEDDPEGMLAKAADPAWKALAKARAEPVAERLKRYVHPQDPQACKLMSKLLRYEDKDDGTVTVRIESRAFHLDACAQTNDDGTCAEKAWVPEWVEQVQTLSAPGFGELFETRFGYHLVFVLEVLEAASKDDPAVQAATREAVLAPWRAARFDEELDALRKKRAVKVVTGVGDAP